jgi:anti-sigma28 factor (negative regulator of flagellin synthesis)
MRVDGKPDIKLNEPKQSRSQIERDVALPQADKVSIEKVREVEALAETVRASMGMNRNVRLRELETAIRQGNYQPNISRLAEKIVQAAEMDARIRALFLG